MDISFNIQPTCIRSLTCKENILIQGNLSQFLRLGLSFLFYSRLGGAYRGLTYCAPTRETYCAPLRKAMFKHVQGRKSGQVFRVLSMSRCWVDIRGPAKAMGKHRLWGAWRDTTTCYYPCTPTPCCHYYHYCCLGCCHVWDTQ